MKYFLDIISPKSVNEITVCLRTYNKIFNLCITSLGNHENNSFSKE